jgi:hypothetical protein
VISDNDLWKYEDGCVSFEMWIADPEIGPSVGRRMVYDYMRLYRISIVALERHGTDIATLMVDVGVAKLIYLQHGLENSLQKGDIETVKTLLHDGASMTLQSLRLKHEPTTACHGTSTAYCGKDSKDGSVFLMVKVGKENQENAKLLHGQMVQFVIREKTSKAKEKKNAHRRSKCGPHRPRGSGPATINGDMEPDSSGEGVPGSSEEVL